MTSLTSKFYKSSSAMAATPSPSTAASATPTTGPTETTKRGQEKRKQYLKRRYTLLELGKGHLNSYKLLYTEQISKALSLSPSPPPCKDKAVYTGLVYTFYCVLSVTVCLCVSRGWGYEATRGKEERSSCRHQWRMGWWGMGGQWDCECWWHEVSEALQCSVCLIMTL